MNIDQIVEKFVENPERMRMGAGKLSNRYKCRENDIYTARFLARKRLSSGTGDVASFRENTVALKVDPKSITTTGKLSLPLRKAPKPYEGGNPNNVLVIGDTHEPFCKQGYLEFCREMQEKYDCGSVVHIGDLVDNHCVSYHEHDPNGRSIGDEFEEALINCKRWYETFPNVKVCIGNHDRLPFRKAFTAGLPSNWLKSYQEIFESPKGWEWDFVHNVAGVLYQHGTGMSGEMASVNAARENRQSTVIGHLHTVCNTRFLASQKDLIFGCSVGCGIDHEAYAFAYGKETPRKPVLSCAVIINGRTPINLPMAI